ncbi:MAG: hypothetical protein JNK53_08295 [Phycisphaerae bacterium]|nr:hypothetical protein [Phycisphaerae bacterium]
MNKAIEQFQSFFRSKPDSADSKLSKVRRKPPVHPGDAERATEGMTADLRERTTRYMGLLVARDVQGLVDAIVQDLDKEQILRDVAALRSKHPRMSDARLCEVLITSSSNAMSVAAVASGLAWAVPVVGIATGSVATAAELVAMIVYQSRLVVSVAAVHGVDIRAKERSRDVIVCIASSTAGTAVQLGVRAAVRTLAERIAAALARRTATAMVKSIPIAGTVAGLVGGAAGAVFNRWAVKAVGRYAVRYYGAGKRGRRVPPVASRPQ